MMADDDLDKLLDEVERKFCSSGSATSPRPQEISHGDMFVKTREGQRKQSSLQTTQSIKSISEDVDALLQELMEDGDLFPHEVKTKQFPQETDKVQRLSCLTGGRKCCPVFVGGSSVTNGVGTATSKRACDQLRCLSCDFRVLTFDDYEWDPSCDYLFFRTNMPNCQKMRAKLKRRPGRRAYACQCSWVSASAPTELSALPRLRWVCGKHQD